MTRRPLLDRIQPLLPELVDFYKRLHANPELSLQEERTAHEMARAFASAGFDVTQGIGGHGVVGVLDNGPGPTLLLRADMDALPMEEKTGLPYASQKRVTGHDGKETGVMHACGHDGHCAILAGAAAALSGMRDSWSGRLLVVAQPGEEGFKGALSMLQDRLYQRFGHPDACLALHLNPTLDADTVGYTPGPAMAGAVALGVRVKGISGHASQPHTAVDPIVLASRLVLALQTIVSREIEPTEPAVLSVTRFNAGQAANIIPDSVDLLLNMRFAKDHVRDRMLAAVKRMLQAEAMAAGLEEPLWPEVEVLGGGAFPPLVNDPDLTRRLVGAFREHLGPDRVIELPFQTVSEDFTYFGLQDPPCPLFFHWVGASDPATPPDQRASLHSPCFAPPPEPTIRTGILSMCLGALEVLDKG